MHVLKKTHEIESASDTTPGTCLVFKTDLIVTHSNTLSFSTKLIKDMLLWWLLMHIEQVDRRRAHSKKLEE
jgi:hypothetical protein